MGKIWERFPFNIKRSLGKTTLDYAMVKFYKFELDWRGGIVEERGIRETKYQQVNSMIGKYTLTLDTAATYNCFFLEHIELFVNHAYGEIVAQPVFTTKYDPKVLDSSKNRATLGELKHQNPAISKVYFELCKPNTGYSQWINVGDKINEVFLLPYTHQFNSEVFSVSQAKLVVNDESKYVDLTPITISDTNMYYSVTYGFKDGVICLGVDKETLRILAKVTNNKSTVVSLLVTYQ